MEKQICTKRNLVLKGTMLAYSVTIILFSIFAYALTFYELEDIYFKKIASIITIISILVAGSTFSRRLKNNGWLYGASVAAIYLFIQYIITSIMKGSFVFTYVGISSYMISLVIGAISGVIGINMKKKI